MGRGEQPGPDSESVILLDTQVLIWLLFDDQKLGTQARRVIDDAWKVGEAYVSAISFWEITMLHEKRRLDVLLDVDALRANLLTEGLLEAPLTGAIGIRAVRLPDLPRDPADRIVVATALEGYQLVTADQEILGWSGALDRMDART